MADQLRNINRGPAFDPERRSQAFWTHYEDQNLRAGDLVANQQINEYERRLLAQTLMSSGFLHVGDRQIKDSDDDGIRPGDMVVGDTGSDTNQFYIYAPDEQYRAFVNGWTITLYNVRGNSAAAGPSDDYLSIELNEAPATGSRFDMVWLEVYKKELSSSEDIYPWGNVDTDETAISNDTADSNSSLGVLNAIVEVRSVIRVADGVDYANHPLGMDDTDNVLARGSKSADTIYTFSYQGQGLWRAGNGSSGAKTALGTIDGYSYALPIAVIARRNRANWSSSNLNGAEAIGTTATRPDGLSYNEVVAGDLDDLRPHVSPQHDLSEITRRSRDLIARNTLRLGLRQDDVSAALQGNELLRGESLPSTSRNSVRRRWSDEEAAQTYSAFLTTGSDDSGLSDVFDYDHSDREITIDATDVATGAVVDEDTPEIRWVSTGDAVVLTSAGWSGLGTASATVVLDTSGSGYQASGEFMIAADIVVPAGGVLTKVPTEVHSATRGSTDMTVVSQASDLNFSNVTGTGWGLVVDGRTRGIVDVVRRQQVTASGTTAKASGPIVLVSAGTARGRLITGLSNGDTVDVLYGRNLGTGAADDIEVFYSYRTPMTPALPTTLAIEMLYMEPSIVSSNLGTGGGHRGQPYLNPLLHVPESDDAHTTEPSRPDAEINNPRRPSHLRLRRRLGHDDTASAHEHAVGLHNGAVIARDRQRGAHLLRQSRQDLRGTRPDATDRAVAPHSTVGHSAGDDERGRLLER